MRTTRSSKCAATAPLITRRRAGIDVLLQDARLTGRAAEREQDAARTACRARPQRVLRKARCTAGRAQGLLRRARCRAELVVQKARASGVRAVTCPRCGDEVLPPEIPGGAATAGLRAAARVAPLRPAFIGLIHLSLSFRCFYSPYSFPKPSTQSIKRPITSPESIWRSQSIWRWGADRQIQIISKYIPLIAKYIPLVAKYVSLSKNRKHRLSACGSRFVMLCV